MVLWSLLLTLIFLYWTAFLFVDLQTQALQCCCRQALCNATLFRIYFSIITNIEQHLLYNLFYDDVTINFSCCLLYVFCIYKSRLALNQVNRWSKTMLASLIIFGILQWQVKEKLVANVLKYNVATSETYRMA